MNSGKLTGIAYHQIKRGEMICVSEADVTVEHGVENDFRGKPGNRQVTVLSSEAWQQACAQLDSTLDWTNRRANLLVEGLQRMDLVGARLIIGEVELKITRETDPCERMEEVKKGLFDALASNWRGGVCCRVIKAGRVKINDPVELISE